MIKLSQQTKIHPNLEGLKNQFINDSFITVADKDYLTSRICYKYGLFENFLWSAEQCIEKYIKAILLFHDYSTKEIGHDLKKGIELIVQIPDVKWDFDDDFNTYVKMYLNDYGKNRYFDTPIRNLFPVELLRKWTEKQKQKVNADSYLSFLNDSQYKNSNYLNQLDNAVWQIRRYCFCIPFWRQNRVRLLSERLKYLSSDELKNNPTKLNTDGYLGDIRKGKYDVNLRNALVWRNKYFSYRNLKNGGLIIEHFEKVPMHLLYKQVLKDPWFKKNLKLSNAFINSMKNELGIVI